MLGLLRKRSFLLATSLVFCAAYAIAAAPAGAEVSVDLIIDASKSMYGPLNPQDRTDATPKIEVVKSGISAILKEKISSLRSGIVSFGSGTTRNCLDYSRILPVEFHGFDEVKNILAGIQPKGLSPVTSALGLSIKDSHEAGGKRIIFLFADGQDDCAPDPCSLMKNELSSSAGFEVHTIGLGIMSEAVIEQLKCISRAGRGEFHSVMHDMEVEGFLRAAIDKAQAEEEAREEREKAYAMRMEQLKQMTSLTITLKTNFSHFFCDTVEISEATIDGSPIELLNKTAQCSGETILFHGRYQEGLHTLRLVLNKKIWKKSAKLGPLEFPFTIEIGQQSQIVFKAYADLLKFGLSYEFNAVDSAQSQ